MQKILEQLGLAAVNDGTWLGAQPLADASAPLIESINPATNEAIASVRQTTPDEYEQVLVAAQTSFEAWREAEFTAAELADWWKSWAASMESRVAACMPPL